MNKKKLLLLRFSSIGDIVLTTPIIRCLKLQLGAEIHFLTKPQFAQILEGNPYISNIWSLDESDSSQIQQLKDENFEGIIDLHNNLRSRKISWQLGVPSYRFHKLNIQKWLYVHFKYPPLPDLHLVDRYFQAYEKLGIKNDDAGLDFFINADVSPRISLPPKFYTLALGAAHFTKKILPEHIRSIFLQVDLPVVLLGGKEEETLGKELEEQFNHVINAAGKTTIPESAHIISLSTFIVAPDTGMMHIAAALKVPNIVVWGSTAKPIGMFPYYGDNDIPTFYSEVAELDCRPCTKIGRGECPKGHFKCMKNQDIPQLVEKIKEFYLF